MSNTVLNGSDKWIIHTQEDQKMVRGFVFKQAIEQLLIRCFSINFGKLSIYCKQLDIWK